MIRRNVRLSTPLMRHSTGGTTQIEADQKSKEEERVNLEAETHKMSDNVMAND